MSEEKNFIDLVGTSADGDLVDLLKQATAIQSTIQFSCLAEQYLFFEFKKEAEHKKNEVIDFTVFVLGAIKTAKQETPIGIIKIPILGFILKKQCIDIRHELDKLEEEVIDICKSVEGKTAESLWLCGNCSIDMSHYSLHLKPPEFFVNQMERLDKILTLVKRYHKITH